MTRKELMSAIKAKGLKVNVKMTTEEMQNYYSSLADTKDNSSTIKLFIFNGIKHDEMSGVVILEHNKNNINVQAENGVIYNNVLRKEILAENYKHCSYFI